MQLAGRPVRVTRTSGGKWAREFRESELVGVDYGIREDLAGMSELKDVAAAFDRRTDDVPPNPDVNPHRSRGINAGTIHRFLMEPQTGDVVIAPGSSAWLVGRLAGGYFYRPGRIPAHCYPVRWMGQIPKADLQPGIAQALTSWLPYFSVRPGAKGYAELEEALAAIPEAQELAPPTPVTREARLAAALAAIEQARALLMALQDEAA